MDEIPELVTQLPEDGAKATPKPNSQQIPKPNPSTSNDQLLRNDLNVEEPVVHKKIPITIITGYLGSGKSTLLEKIGQVSKKRLAIILNEFGDSSAIEKSVTIKDETQQEAVQEWLDIGNGCLCCTVKDNGVLAIENLIENSRGKIDYILLETTGVADPAPVAKMFWLDDGLASSVYIDGVVTVIDSENILKCLDDVGGHWHQEHNHLKLAQSINKDELTEEEIEDEQEKLKQGITTAHLQIALSDSILINKIDKIEKLPDYQDKLNEITKRIKSINSTTPIHTTKFGDIELDKILDLHAFEANSDRLIQSLNYVNNSVYHDDRITTITLSCPFFNHDKYFQRVENFLQYVLWENEANGKEIEIHRTKGIMVLESEKNVDIRVIQGVRGTYDIVEGGQLAPSITENKFVFIGKNLTHEDLNAELQKFLLWD